MTFTTYVHGGTAYGERTTCGWGINAQGQIVGHYLGTFGALHGFLLDDGVFTSFDIPGGTDVLPQGVNPKGEIVGVYYDLATELERGLLIDKWNNFTPIDFPGAVRTSVRRNNANGDLVGAYSDPSGRIHGYLMTAN